MEEEKGEGEEEGEGESEGEDEGVGKGEGESEGGGEGEDDDALNEVEEADDKLALINNVACNSDNRINTRFYIMTYHNIV